jgi:hypothetical protein
MQWYQINIGKVAHETIDGETIIINFDSGAYYSTDELGMEIWEHLKPGASLTGLTEAIIRGYNGNRPQIESALQNFITEMLHEGLVVATESIGSESPNPLKTTVTPAPFKPPVLHKYTDMQDLLLLDPIHDVDAQGWPLPKQG